MNTRIPLQANAYNAIIRVRSAYQPKDARPATTTCTWFPKATKSSVTTVIEYNKTALFAFLLANANDVAMDSSLILIMSAKPAQH